jgi:hypothetical protein
MGTTFAIFSWTGITPELKEVEIIWWRGRERVKAKLEMKATDNPSQSAVFIGSKERIALETSVKVTGSRVKLRQEFSGIVGTLISDGRSVGIICWAISEAILVKKRLNLSALIFGSVKTSLIIEIWSIVSLLLVFLLTAE